MSGDSLFRIFDYEKTLEFYVEWLGFKVNWQHKFSDNSPIYVQVSRDGIILHLSEHHGDYTPGSKVYITVDDSFHKGISEKNYKYNKPGLEQAPWNAPCFEVIDPFSNKLLFTEAGKNLTWQ